MNRLFRVAVLAAFMVLAVDVSTASADSSSGSYVASGGESCSWSGFGNSVTLHCSGYSRGQYVNYNCDLYYYGSSSMSWSCRSMNGATWPGSR